MKNSAIVAMLREQYNQYATSIISVEFLMSVGDENTFRCSVQYSDDGLETYGTDTFDLKVSMVNQGD